MRGPKPPPIELTCRQRLVLERLVRQATCAQRTVTRAQIILGAADGLNNQQIATCLGLDRQQVRIWRQRWFAVTDRLKAVEAQEKEGRLQQHLEQVLVDAPRPGSPALFSPEQIIDIIAVACEDPQDSGHPLSHWTPSALAREVVHRQIVASISSRQVGRFLKRGGLKAAPESLLAAPPI